MKEENPEFMFVALMFCSLLFFIFGLQMFYSLEIGYSAADSPIWKFFTSPLGHSDAEHLFNNVFFIALFGSVYELFTSGRTFLGTFAVSALVGNLTAFIFFPGSAIIGASGGAAGVLAALAVYRPNTVGLALGVPAPMWAVFLIYIGTNLVGLGAQNNVAYEAHLFGAFAGAVIGLYLRDSIERSEEKSEDEIEIENWKRKIEDWERKYMISS